MREGRDTRLIRLGTRMKSSPFASLVQASWTDVDPYDVMVVELVVGVWKERRVVRGPHSRLVMVTRRLARQT